MFRRKSFCKFWVGGLGVHASFGNAEFFGKDEILHAGGYIKRKNLVVCGRSLGVVCIKSKLNVYVDFAAFCIHVTRVWRANSVRC